jgi:dCMP deaminase
MKFSNKNLKLHIMYLDIAKRISEMSFAERKKVGCVSVKNGRIISMGWNGMPSKFTNVAEIKKDGQLVTKKEVIHAEMNMFAKLAKSNDSIEGADLYVTLSPCFECSKLIMQSGIKRVFFIEKYRDNSPFIFLKRAKIKIYDMSNYFNQ